MSLTVVGVTRVRDVIGQPLPGVVAGRYIIARNGDSFEVWQVVRPDVLKRRAVDLESAHDARALARLLAEDREAEGWGEVDAFLESGPNPAGNQT